MADQSPNEHPVPVHVARRGPGGVPVAKSMFTSFDERGSQDAQRGAPLIQPFQTE